MKESPILRRIERSNLCVGCGLCASIAPENIAIGLDEKGFLRPRQNDSLTAAQEELIASSCPGIEPQGWDESPNRSPYWGPYRSISTAYSEDATERHGGSSGGVITAIARFALEQGLVDGVLLNGARLGFPMQNEARIARTAEQVRAGAGSRYAPSSPLRDVRHYLDSGERFLFVGKPCDVSGLRRLAVTDPRVDATFPFMLSFFCGGIPSQAGTDEIVRKMGLAPGEVVEFHYRGSGWPGRARAICADGSQGSMSYEESWGGHLSKHVQFRCKICPDAVGGVADIVCADAWHGGETGYPTFEDRDGRSLLMARSEVGQMLVDAAKHAGQIRCEPLVEEEIILMQPSQARRKGLTAARTLAMLALGRTRPNLRNLDIGIAARKYGLREQFRNFLGTGWRILNGRT